SPTGPTPGIDYGRHFLYQGHENASPLAYITRINLDVPRGDAHRVSLLTPVNPATNQTGFGSIDGSTFNPFTTKLLFTQEAGANGGVIEGAQATLDAFLGKAGFCYMSSIENHSAQRILQVRGIAVFVQQALHEHPH